MPLKLTKPLKIAALLTLLSVAFIISGFWIFNKDNRVLQKISQKPGGEVFGEQANIPADWPEEIAIPSYCRLNQAQESKNPHRKKISLILESTEPVQTILSFYERELEKSNWAVSSMIKPKGGELRTYQKNSQSLEILIFEDEKAEKTLTFLNLTKPRQQ